MNNSAHGLARLLANVSPPQHNQAQPASPIDSTIYARDVAWGLVHALESAAKEASVRMPALASSLNCELEAARKTAYRLDLLTRIGTTQ